MTTMPTAYAAKEAFLEELCQPLRLELHSNGQPLALHLADNFQFVPLPDAPGFELARLLAPAGYSATLLRGEDGAHAPRFAAPQSVRVEVLAGRLRWWQASWGEQKCNGSYRLLERGDITCLAPNEQHTYLALSPCLTYNLFSPAVPELL